MKRLLFFLLGVGLGVGLAMVVGWVLFPMLEPAATPASLRADYREEYVRLVAVAYVGDGDLATAETRLRALQQEPYAAPLVDTLERWVAEERSADLVMPLAQLAYDLNVATPEMTMYLQERE